MAVSGAMSTTNQYIKYTIECVQNSQDINANQSNVTVKVRVWRTNSGYTTYGSGTIYCKIDGVTHSASIGPSQKITSSGIELFNKTVNVGHAGDGTKTLSMSAWIQHSQFSSNEQGYNQWLTTIPRTSNVQLTATTITAGTSVGITINRASGNFVHDAYFLFGVRQYAIQYGISTSATYTIPLECLDQIPNASAGVGTIRVYTINNNNIVGSVDIGVTILVPNSAGPTFNSLDIFRQDNGVPSSWGVLVQGISKASVYINGVNAYHGAKISKYQISGGGYSGTSETMHTGLLNKSGTITFTGTITDTRGKSTTKTASCEVVPYQAPRIDRFTAVRCTKDGKEHTEGTYVKVRCGITYSSVKSKNWLNAVVKYQGANGKWSAGHNVTSGSDLVVGGDLSPDASYQIKLTVSDALRSNEATIMIPTASTTMDLLKGGTGIALGKVAEREGFEVGWSSNFLKDVTYHGALSQVSDGTLKEDIEYFGESEKLSTIQNGSFKDFIRDDFKPCVFKYKDTEELITGFIAQDVVDSDIGKLFVGEAVFDNVETNEQTTSLVFNISGYATIIAKALQEEILEKDAKIKSLEDRLASLEMLLQKGD